MKVKNDQLTAMIILHFHLQPQFIYELFHINFTVRTMLSFLPLRVFR